MCAAFSTVSLRSIVTSGAFSRFDHQVARGQALAIDEALLAHPVGVVHLAEVARAVVVEDHDHGLALLEAIGQLDQSGHRRARRVAGEDAFLARDAAGHDRRVAVGDLLEVIDQAEVDVLRQEVLADAFGDVRIDLVLVEDAGLLVFLEDRSVGVDAPRLDRRLASPSGISRRRRSCRRCRRRPRGDRPCRRSAPRSPARSVS